MPTDAANHALAVVTFNPPSAALLPGAVVSFAVIGSPANFGGAHLVGRQPGQALSALIGGASIQHSTAHRTAGQRVISP